MASVAQRVSILALVAAALAIPAAPATAQVDRTIVLNIMVECAKIDDPTARLACYDNNIRQVGGQARNTVPGQTVRGVSGGAAPVDSQGPGGFGAEDVDYARPGPAARPAGQIDEIHPHVASVTPREPGIYRVGMDDGTMWEFAEGVSSQFRLPRRGDTIEIERGALGSYLMQIDGQSPVPVRRIR
jgi:hypothetical protein